MLTLMVSSKLTQIGRHIDAADQEPQCTLVMSKPANLTLASTLDDRPVVGSARWLRSAAASYP
jgi:hypothetical protein